MKKCLIVALDFPPSPSIAAVRLYHMCRSLLDQDWNVQVLTVKSDWVQNPSDEYPMEELRTHPNLEIIETKMWFPSLYGYYKKRWYESRVSNAILKRLFRKLEIDVSFGWKKFAVRAAVKANRISKVDVILASAPPYVCFSIAKTLSRELDAPYVMDYRDTWSIYPHRAKASQRTMDLERLLLAEASAVVTISKSFAKAMEDEFHLKDKMNVIENGFSDEGKLIEREASAPNKLKIVYAGTFYLPKRRIDPFIEALKLIKEKNPNMAGGIEFHYFGPSSNMVQEQAERNGVTELIVDHGSQSRSTVHKALQSSDYALVITSVEAKGDVWDNGIMTGKVFENLKYRVPTLLIAPEGADLLEVIDGLNAGKSFTGIQVEEISNFLMNEVQEKSVHSFENVNRYEWSQLGLRLSNLLHSKLRA